MAYSSDYGYSIDANKENISLDPRNSWACQSSTSHGHRTDPNNSADALGIFIHCILPRVMQVTQINDLC